MPSDLGRFFCLEQLREVSARVRDRRDVTIVAADHVDHSNRANPDFSDRVLLNLRNGLLAPACCPDGSVCSDLSLAVTGTAVPYDSLVYLHRRPDVLRAVRSRVVR
jgi:hypothetical protein